MTFLIRWLKFNAVGALGTVLQLSVLALFHSCFPRHPLCALASAVEITVLHNFLWHVHCTWSDRPPATSRPKQCVHFHLTNGAVSICGNLLIVGLLLRVSHMPLLPANVVAIVACSVVNFSLGDSWVFRAQEHTLGR